MTPFVGTMYRHTPDGRTLLHGELPPDVQGQRLTEALAARQRLIEAGAHLMYGHRPTVHGVRRWTDAAGKRCVDILGRHGGCIARVIRVYGILGQPTRWAIHDHGDFDFSSEATTIAEAIRHLRCVLTAYA